MELSSLFLAGKGSALTSFFSTAFLVVFLPFCLVVYSLMPRRGKKYFLLAADCAFFLADQRQAARIPASDGAFDALLRTVAGQNTVGDEASARAD